MSAWQSACDNLSPDIKQHLISVQNEKIDVLHALLNEARRKKEICLQKRWRVSLNERIIILRDMIDKIIEWVNRFKVIGDVAVQFDPAPASLAWAGVRFLLAVSVSDNACFESTINGLESVARLISRYASFEALYLKKGTSMYPELQSMLATLYTQVLHFLANGIKYFSQSTATRLIKNIFQTSQGEELRRIAETNVEMERLARMSDTETHQENQSDLRATKSLTESLLAPINRLVDASVVYARVMEEERFQQFLSWLSCVPYIQHHSRHSGSRLPGSVEWLLKHPQYKDWKESSSSSILLLTGIPGCGKTKDVSAVIDAFLHEQAVNSLAAPIAYFYCGEAKCGTGYADVNEVIRSLTRQLAVIDKSKRKVHEQVWLGYQRMTAEAKLDGFETPKLNASQCADLILPILDSNPATIILDAIDEVDEANRHDLFSFIRRITDESASVVKIFISSREDSSLLLRLPHAAVLSVKGEETKTDLANFVRHQVTSSIQKQSLLNGDVSAHLQEEVVTFLLTGCREMFLWVELQIEKLCQLKSTASVVEMIQDLPGASSKSLNEIYADLLNRTAEKDPGSRKYAHIAFSWLLCMYEPLSSQAFLAAVSSFGSNKNRSITLPELLNMCSNLVAVNTKSDTIHFIHFSFRQYLQTKPDFDIPRAHEVAANSCLEKCGQDSLLQLESPLKPESNFLLYSALYWPRHYRAAEPWDKKSSLTDSLKNFIFYDEGETSLPFLAWIETAKDAADLLSHELSLKIELNAVPSSSMTPFFAACVYGLTDILPSIMACDSFDIDEKSSMGQTGIYLAAAFNRVDTVDLLLSHGADISIEGGRHKTPFFAGCSNGHVKVVELILSEDKYPLTPGTIEIGFQSSLRAGHGLVAMLLLRNGLAIATQEDYNRILEDTYQAGLFKVVDHMMQNFREYAKSSKSSSSKLLDMAIRKGQPSFFRKYAQTGSIPSHALALAALFGQLDIAQYCLDSGIHIEEEGFLGSPLRCACLMGNESVVRVLITRGADVNRCGPLGTALHAASMSGHLFIVMHLINSGANVNGIGGFFGNALQSAAYRGHFDVAQALLCAGARIAEGGRYSDSLHAAVEGGHEDISKLFVDSGFKYPMIWSPPMASRSRSLTPYKNLLKEAFDARVTVSAGSIMCPSLHLANSTDAEISDFDEVLEGMQDLSKQNGYAFEGRSMKHSPNRSIEIEKSSSDNVLLKAVLQGKATTVHLLVSHHANIRLLGRHIMEGLETASGLGNVAMSKLRHAMVIWRFSKFSLRMRSAIEILDSWKISISCLF
ncbi:unnamed protein product [Penicillium salamii]|nr:unnamed protein product [Penicillium salamii]CAG8292382.1 unnamed protein product [Penicillium salamii]CAG8377152.1 unnamed protein product [Penicillium salamii]CAG8378987.1 unnamed protein product [Penicillium salamii]